MLKLTNATHDMVNEGDAVITRLVVDDSGSVKGHEDKLIGGTNTFVREILTADGGRGKYLLEISSMNGYFCRPLAPVNPGHQISPEDFSDYGNTPLYGTGQQLLEQQIRDFKFLRNGGTRTRTASGILTDGFNYDPYNEYNTQEVLEKLAPLARDMAGKEDHNLFGIGIDTGSTNAELAQYVTRTSSGGWLTNMLGFKAETDGSDTVGYPTEYHVAFQMHMGFKGSRALVLEAENTGEAIAAAVKEASQSITRGGNTERLVKKGF